MLKYGNVVFSVGSMLMGGITAVAQQRASTAQPSTEHTKLGVFVGTWQGEVEMKPGLLGPGGRMSLAESCEWLTGRFSLVCRTETPAGNPQTLTVLTYDPDARVYRLYEFNSTGRNNSAEGTVYGDTWTFDGKAKVDGKVVKSRSTIKLPSPDSATAKSEVSIDGGPWILVMELTGTRAKESLTDQCVPHGNEGWPFGLFECYRKRLSSH